MTTRVLVKSICVTAALVMLLSACGRKGPLETPRATRLPAATADEAAPESAPAPRERRFILDGLLE